VGALSEKVSEAKGGVDIELPYRVREVIKDVPWNGRE
jgi:hypothetical protein